MYLDLAVLAAFAFLYSIVAGRLERTPINGPVVFLAFGFAVGPHALGWVDLNVDGETLRTIAELTLALVLFTDSSNADLGTLRKAFALPARMLLVGLPLTIALGIGAGLLLFPDLPILSIAILATMLAPTDAALGEAVVTNQALPAPIREGLNVESGLNDGICVPILFTFLALAAETQGSAGTIAARALAEAIGIGLVVGVGLSAAGRLAIRAAAARGWVQEPWTRLSVVALAFSCFALAQTLGGSGFIACFAGGLVFGGLVEHHKERLLSGAEGLGGAFSLLTWVLFGAAIIGNYLSDVDWHILAYAGLSLTVIRMLPVAVSLIGSGLRWDAQLFLGWFGPRGLASIVFAVIVAGEQVGGGDTLLATVLCTVTLSVLAHGLSAEPLAGAYAQRARSDPGLQP